jgi:hypothetical protein
MPTPDAFNPDKWYKSSGTKNKPKKDNETMTDTVNDSMGAIGKLAVGGMIATMALGLGKAFSGAFKK